MLLSDITFIVPIYCTTPESLLWLKECLDSIVANKCSVVAYDDGSTVDLQPILGIYNQDYKFVQNVNRGVSYARNRAIELVTTKLILPLDCDDRAKPNAAIEMLKYWNRYEVPVYPDVAKFGDVNIPHYPLLDFDCDHIVKHVGFTSVNVLHTKAMWEQIGGYDESIAFYEDGEYNARLLGTFCGVRCPLPLIDYRMHAKQRTKTYERLSSKFAKQILEKVRNYTMACPGCSKRRSNSSSRNNMAGKQQSSFAPSLNIIQDVSGMPLMDEKGYVLAQYIGGKGRGKHWYRGLGTNNGYRVTFGAYVYVDKTDVKEAGATGNSFFIRVARTSAKAAPVAPAVTREAVITVDRTPVEDAAQDIDISKLGINKLKALELTAKQAEELLIVEQNGRNRSNVVEWLELLAETK